MSSDSLVLKKYNIIEKIASGGMAEIFLASRKEVKFHNKFFVIKRVLPNLADKPEYLVFLKDEAKALSLLNHHNILGYHDFFYENDQFYLVMEFINGKTLREVFNDMEKANQYFSIEYLLYIITEVAAGLDYAHRSYDHISNKSLNLVHRDLNPQNIMISYEGQIKIIDFGISKFDIRDDFTKTGMLKGKFGYMSPEQVEGLEVDARTDIFALGILCWELLTNKRLFDGEDDFEKFNKIKNHQLVSVCSINSLVSKELDAIVMKALAPKVEERYQTAGELGYDLSRYIFTKFPDFRPEKFQKIISKLYEADFKKSIERIKSYFQTEVESDQPTQVTRDYYIQKADEERLKAEHRAKRELNSTGILVPDSFELKMNKAKLKLDVPQHEAERQVVAPVVEVAPVKVKRVKKPKVTLLDPKRYTVQAGAIKTSQFHEFLNGKIFKNLVYLMISGGISCVLFFSYELGYFNFLIRSITKIIK